MIVKPVLKWIIIINAVISLLLFLISSCWHDIDSAGMIDAYFVFSGGALGVLIGTYISAKKRQSPESNNDVMGVVLCYMIITTIAVFLTIIFEHILLFDKTIVIFSSIGVTLIGGVICLVKVCNTFRK